MIHIQNWRNFDSIIGTSEATLVRPPYKSRQDLELKISNGNTICTNKGDSLYVRYLWARHPYLPENIPPGKRYLRPVNNESSSFLQETELDTSRRRILAPISRSCVIDFRRGVAQHFSAKRQAQVRAWWRPYDVKQNRQLQTVSAGQNNYAT